MFIGGDNVDGLKECSQAKRGLCSIRDLSDEIRRLEVPTLSTAARLRLEATLLRRINPTLPQHQVQCRDSQTNPFHLTYIMSNG
ncbi:uncharacterized protein LACBIDRAFT_316236 [Laccaria bicolor S238N-H82]|uniref:Predicted protein n=1 Tax=Laccaria bicolor (strain S238N-H82 / ATCC MYA-4686) TaxID=486041 RepID=B0E556_LACBS|nr:uncharacterized protein LACBIDRAFT_316236 [Laccaria bicolor S238N-H82]EDQ98025.1 predicted protein [Laccaria bicolor S238N-H82]|eukprot:XP_001891324.1 predicted protein [Laccaria bicolor S238N-H82]